MDRGTKRRSSYPVILGLIIVILSVIFALKGWWGLAIGTFIFGIFIPGLKDLKIAVWEGLMGCWWSAKEEDSDLIV